MNSYMDNEYGDWAGVATPKQAPRAGCREVDDEPGFTPRDEYIYS
jgi:hypothetical protein